MKLQKIKTIICTVFIIGALVLPVTSFSAKSYGGGTWNYGSNTFNVWSEYLNNTKTHRATVHNNRSGVNTCVDSTKKNWAIAKQLQVLGDQVAGAANTEC